MTYLNTKQLSTYALAFFGVVVAFLLVGVGLAVAQGGGSGAGGAGGMGTGGNAGSGMGTQDQLQTQDRIQDPTTHTGDEPLQTRDQLRTQDQLYMMQIPAYNFAAPLQTQDQLRTQDRIQDPTTHTGDEPLQTRDQLRIMDQVMIDSPAALQSFISSTNASSEAATNQFATQVRAAVQGRNQVQAATMAFMAAQNMVGPNGGQMAQLAQGVSSSTQVMAQAELQIQNRNWFQNFFFGGDTQAANQIQTQLQQNQQRMTQLQQNLATCGCDASVQTMLQEQLQNMQIEQTRLQALADQEQSRWGLFSWRF